MALEVIEQALVWLKTQPIWLCTVLSAEGSAPHDTGSMLVTNSEGQHKGTLSGGCIEEQFLSELLHGKFNQASQPATTFPLHRRSSLAVALPLYLLNIFRLQRRPLRN